VLDYVRARRYGNPERGEAPDRAFSMKGRSPDALQRLVDAWHERLNAARDAPDAPPPGPRKRFRPSGLAPRHWERAGPDGAVWTVEELPDSHALEAEGRAMQHCVADYSGLVLRGLSSIWSVRFREGEGEPCRALTLEVRNSGRTVVQARGRRNRPPNPTEKDLLRFWAREHGLRLDI